MILSAFLGFVFGFGLAMLLGLCRCAAKRMPSIDEVAARDERALRLPPFPEGREMLQTGRRD